MRYPRRWRNATSFPFAAYFPTKLTSDSTAVPEADLPETQRRWCSPSCQTLNHGHLIKLHAVRDIRKVVVIGAGISGLACAFRLRQLGIPVLILEASAKAGGVISTVRRNGFLFEAGPQCPRFPKSVWTLIFELGLQEEFIAGDPRAKRYILRDGQLHRAPFSAGGLFTTSLVGLKSKYSLLSEVFRRSHPPTQEESLAEFVDRKFGAEVLDYLVDPFISTIFFGDPHKMGMLSAFPALVEWEQSRGSVVRGALSAYRSKRNRNAKSPLAEGSSARDSHSKRGDLHVTDALPSLGSFKQGMGALVERLAEKLRDHLRFGVNAESITAQNGDNQPDPVWRIRLSSGEELSAGAVVVATPAYAAAPLLGESMAQLSVLLAGIEHAPMDVVSCAFDRRQIRHPLDGFGFMVPRRERLHTFCTFWNSSLFPAHARSGTVVMTSFAARGGDGNLDEVPDDVLGQHVEAENAAVLGITGGPIDRMTWKYPRALPQYNVGHAQRVKEIREALSQVPGLFLAGNYLAGRSIGDCVDTAFQAADLLHSRFSS
jgi:oxygen-dependent protoporphyrinogen oxidase